MYLIQMINNEPYIINGAYKCKILSYDSIMDVFIREDDCKLSANLVNKYTLINILKGYK